MGYLKSLRLNNINVISSHKFLRMYERTGRNNENQEKRIESFSSIYTLHTTSLL